MICTVKFFVCVIAFAPSKLRKFAKKVLLFILTTDYSVANCVKRLSILQTLKKV